MGFLWDFCSFFVGFCKVLQDYLWAFCGIFSRVFLGSVQFLQGLYGISGVVLWGFVWDFLWAFCGIFCRVFMGSVQFLQGFLWDFCSFCAGFCVGFFMGFLWDFLWGIHGICAVFARFYGISAVFLQGFVRILQDFYSFCEDFIAVFLRIFLPAFCRVVLGSLQFLWNSAFFWDFTAGFFQHF